MPTAGNPVAEIKDSREAIDDLLSVIYRYHDSDDDTESVELGLQTLIEREFNRIDHVVAGLEE